LAHHFDTKLTPSPHSFRVFTDWQILLN